MTQSHFPPHKLYLPGDSWGYWSTRPNGKLLLFVHGFAGHPLTTWGQYFHLVTDDPDFAGHDIVSWGYDGKHRRAQASARDLTHTLDEFFSSPIGLLAAPWHWFGSRPDDFQFTSVTIVAHSLGAIVSRFCLLAAAVGSKPWLTDTRLVLYAPAHMGAQILSLVRASMFAPTLLTVAGAVSKYAVLRDLEPEDGTWKLLREETHKALAKQTNGSLATPCIIHADRETIVSVNPFCPSDAAALWTRASHLSVCKPRRDRLERLGLARPHLL